MEASEQTRLQKILKRNGELPKKHMTLLKDAMKFLDGHKSSQIWLNKIKSNLTKKKYAKSLFRYCADVGFNPDELLLLKPNHTEIMLKALQLKEEGKTAQEIAQSVDEYEAEHVLENYLAKAKFKDKLGVKSAVISFYKANKRPLSSDVAPTVIQKDKQPEEYSLPTVDDVEKMASATQNYRDEFLIWFLESTGVRRRTVTKLTFGDLRKIVDVDGVSKIYSFFAKVTEGTLDAIAPILITIGSERLKGKYKGVQQICFLHFKAYQRLIQYVKWLHSKKIPITEHTALFVKFRKPYNTIEHGTIRNIVVDASINAFGNGKVFTPHDMRRFHQTACEKAKIPDNWIKKLQGKKLKQEQNPYSLPKVLDLHKAFKDAVSYFVPTTEPQPHENLARRISQQEQTIKQQKEDFNKQQNTIKKLQNQIKGIMDILNKHPTARIVTDKETKEIEEYQKRTTQPQQVEAELKRYKAKQDRIEQKTESLEERMRKLKGKKIQNLKQDK